MHRQTFNVHLILKDSKTNRKELAPIFARTKLNGLKIEITTRRVAQIKQGRDCFDLSTFKEPYRLEGKKTMGYEIAEQLNWILPV